MTVLALHGWLGRGADWDATAAHLQGMTLDAPDLPGHGAAGLAGTASMDAAADLLAARIKKRHGGRAVVAGYSLGGRLALHLAVRHPARVAGLVLVSASAGLRTPAEQATRRALDAGRAAALRADPERFLAEWLDLPLWDTLSAEQKQRILDARLAQLPTAADGWARALVGMSTGAQPFHGEAIARLGVPVEVVAGGSDEKFAALARTLAGGEVRAEIVPGAGHALLVEAPEAVARAVARVAGSPEAGAS